MKKIYKLIILFLLSVSLIAVLYYKINYSETKTPDKDIIIMEKINFHEVQCHNKKTSKVIELEKNIKGLVLISDIDKSIRLDLRYATTNNFTKTKIYTADICALRYETALKLKNANSFLKKYGYFIKIYDAYRPQSAQFKLWSIVPDARYVANPSIGGSDHSKGCAVDVTLVDKNNKELKMPTGFDDFTGKAARNSKAWTAEERRNVNILTESMKKAGFIPINSEWWHFYDSNKKSYKALDVELEEFLK